MIVHTLTCVGGHFQLVEIQADIKVIHRQSQHHTKNSYKRQQFSYTVDHITKATKDSSADPINNRRRR